MCAFAISGAAVASKLNAEMLLVPEAEISAKYVWDALWECQPGLISHGRSENLLSDGGSEGGRIRLVGKRTRKKGISHQVLQTAWVDLAWTLLLNAAGAQAAFPPSFRSFTPPLSLGWKKERKHRSGRLPGWQRQMCRVIPTNVSGIKQTGECEREGGRGSKRCKEMLSRRSWHNNKSRLCLQLHIFCSYALPIPPPLYIP